MSDADPAAPELTAAGLEALGSDDWARVLPIARRVVREFAAGEPEARIAEQPTGRLAGGAERAALCRAVVADAERRARLVSLLDEAGQLTRVRRATSAAASTGKRQRGPQAERDHRARRDRDQQRVRRLREQRDRERRRAEGATSRADAARREADTARAELAAVRAELREAQRALERAADEQRRAVERERRRSSARLEKLQTELTGVRRQLQEATERAERVATRPEAARPAATTPATEPAPPMIVAGRPSRLPETVSIETAEGVDLLLERRRLVFVDGYNVTRQHRAALGLDEQRAWLVQRLATLVAQRGVRPVVVFDGQRGSSSRPRTGARQVQVRFTAPGITADDELVFAVEALPPDEPVLVVTDDRELGDRLRRLSADVVGTGPFLWATGG